MNREEGTSRSKLSAHSSLLDKSTEKINFLFKKCKNFLNLKNEEISLYFKIDFNETTFGESQKYIITQDSITPLNYTATLSVSINDSTTLDDIAYKPVVITLIEVLPKEKKQKEEKIQTYGQCSLNLFDFLKGEVSSELKLQIHPTPGSSLESLPAEQTLPELEIEISTEQPLINEDDSAKCNFFTVGVDSMYALPESWTTNVKEYAYTAAMPLPQTEEKDSTLVIVNGIQRQPTDPIVKKKRWTDTRGIQAINALYNHNSQLEDQDLEEIGDFLSKEDKEYRQISEKEKARIVWQSERRAYMNQQSNNTFRDYILKTRYWPVEIFRTAVPTGVKGKREEDLSVSYHGVAYIDMAPLLYPGATSIKGAYKIHPFTDTDYTTRTKRKTGVIDDTLKQINSLYDRNFALSPMKKDQKNVEKKDVKKVVKDAIPDGHDLNQSNQNMIDAKSFIVIDLKFEKPLIPRKPFEVLVKNVAELIPPRPKYPLKTNSSEKAVEDYHNQVKSIVASLIEDYRMSMIENDDQQDGLTNKEDDIEQRRRKLLYELNSSGKYFAFKEQLKNSVIKIVREKFLRTNALNDPDEMQQFLSELYVFLTDELHKALNETMIVEDVPLPDHNLTDIEQMKHFAVEAEMNRNFDLAAYYYQERIARDKSKDNFNHWLDYAVFNILIEDYARSEECLKECIAIDQNDINGLLLYSVICTMQEKNDIAETFLERVIVQDKENIVAWTLYAILYEQRGEELNADITFKKAIKLNQVDKTRNTETPMTRTATATANTANGDQNTNEQSEEMLIKKQDEGEF
jgi:hypothetical protein